jgi:hypothetical protein
MKAKITYRGWPGHFCMGHRCVFHLNTLIEFGEKRVVVSTVGDMRPTARIEEIGLDRYFETMAFYAVKEGKYWEANILKAFPFESRWEYDKKTDDWEANKGHFVVVQEIVERLEKEEL